MSFQCGIVGLPNVGKSTLFNALTSTAAAQAANYPFCTIEPNTGRVSVPDDRLYQLADIAKSQKIIPTQIEFVDIAGLVRGASKGEGLGNQFLSHIREVDVIIHVLRCFENDDITHVEGGVDPIRDAEIIETELMLADLQSLEKRLPNLEKATRGGDAEQKIMLELVKKLVPLLSEGMPARTVTPNEEQKKAYGMLQLLTSKPVLYVCNMAEDAQAEDNTHSKRVREKAATEGANVVLISARIEEEIALLESDEEKKEFLATMGMNETGLSKIIRESYSLLGLNTFFTIGPKEARAWTVRKGALAPEAAGVIHTDFQKGFICAETIKYEDYMKYKGEGGAKEAGRMQLNGKEYTTLDGDIFHFRFNV